MYDGGWIEWSRKKTTRSKPHRVPPALVRASSRMSNRLLLRRGLASLRVDVEAKQGLTEEDLVTISRIKTNLKEVRPEMQRILKMFAAFIVVLGLVSLASTSFSAEPKINLQTLLGKRVPILLEFGRGWCIPCKYMKPILADMAKAYTGRTIVMTVDMDANVDLIRQFKIRMMPTQVFIMPDGREFHRHEGVLEREQIVQAFSKMGVPGPTQGAAPGLIPRHAVPR